jgi:hypothetical protein
MHDPLTQAFVIPYGCKNSTIGKTKWRYWKPLVTIWHKDPERGGSDDSCGWSRPKLNEKQRDIVKSLAFDESRAPYFMACCEKSNDNPVLAETLLRQAFTLIAMCLRNRGMKRLAPSYAECCRWAAEMSANPIDNFRSSLCFLSGYHSNWCKEGIPNTTEQDLFWREENAATLFRSVMAYALRERRFWFQHPKWHVHHWRLQFHFAQKFKRWAFSRCCKCGGRFSWGYAPCSGSWYGSGPIWFRSEVGVFHGSCDQPSSACCSEASEKVGVGD